MGRMRTFAGRGAAVVLEARAVLALVVVGTLADVVGRQVETPAAVLTRTVEAVIDVRLWTQRNVRVNAGLGARGCRLTVTIRLPKRPAFQMILRDFEYCSGGIR